MSDPEQSPTESISAELRIGSENLRFSVEITNEPVHIHDLLPFFQRITDKVVEIGVKEAEQQGKCISCKKGCGACCSQLVPVSRAEGYNLLNLIESMPAERQQVIRARFEQNIKVLKDAGVLQMMEQAVSNNDRMQLREVGVNYFRLNLPCPFLEDQSCSIHRDRPLSCREFLVTSDPVHCADTNPETVESLSLPKRISPIIYRMSRDLNEAGRGYLPLIQILESAEGLSSNQASEPA
ncbi:MAG: YkgJ family cysteine cluster protein, partial [Candidatus Thiodiazotropha taylori]|nr:YkgJ family cysteine cluster protein [Candidatus Thiodiazotropha endolucinida]MCG8082480.1 YkgJ family cysteine cluster protein [Candidatus Thiodiazotropha taylori]MCW4230855.1 YkgJ family cysteine cluster protein [Candidatus Thiodiazotropha taylori]